MAKWGTSLAVRIPRQVAEQAAIAEGSEIDFVVDDGAITIRRRPGSCRLEDLLDAITPENQHDETDWGERRGREAW